MLPDPKGMANPVPRDANYPIPTLAGRVRYRGYGCAKEVLSDVVCLSGREGYRSSLVLCWDHQFGYGQHRYCGVQHFVTV